MLAVDEGRQGAFMRINGERLVYVGEPFEFDGVEKELDAEAAAVDGGYFLRGRISRRKARNMLRQF